MTSRRELANAIRALSMDAVEQAQSGHPGMPMGMADIAEVLWNNFLCHNPQDPNWSNRDRFVLSNGHGSMLLYSLLHLSGYPLDIEELKNFRQLHSKTPGHPEVGEAPGVETTTGPLGQGIANAVGMAIAEKALAAQFNRNDITIVDHRTFVFAGDGCLMEGVSHEACALAGTLGLGKLILLWDDNGISIDGKIDSWMEKNPAQRFESYGWRVITAVDGHNSTAVQEALQQACQQSDQPTLICCRTEIGYGSPNKVNTAGVHGSPLGAAEVELSRQQLDWQLPAFSIPEEVYQAWDAKERGQKQQQAWQEQYERYQQAYPQLAVEFDRRIKGQLPADFQPYIEQLLAAAGQSTKSIATRKVNTKVLDKLGPIFPEFMGGSADLTGSNNTSWSGMTTLNAENFNANYLHYGVREFGMAAIMNGIALHRGFIPYGGTFLIFSSYCANAIRMSALMKQRVIYVMTHDSIGLGEDGPTHQPIEQLAMLRALPNCSVWRPADEAEAIVAWQMALENQHQPTVLCMTRQNLLPQERDRDQLLNIRRGAYTLYENHAQAQVIIIATGSELELAVEAAKNSTHPVRVVSMPCCDLFEQQDREYRESVIPSPIRKRIAVEAAASMGWYRYVGLEGKVIALDRFGLSAPYQKIYQQLGLTVEHITQAINELMG